MVIYNQRDIFQSIIPLFKCHLIMTYHQAKSTSYLNSN